MSLLTNRRDGTHGGMVTGYLSRGQQCANRFAGRLDGAPAMARRELRAATELSSGADSGIGYASSVEKRSRLVDCRAREGAQLSL